jgi:hypothetical protein
MPELKEVKLGYACFGIEVDDGKIVNAAPIAKWMIGKSIVAIERWVKSKNGKIR